MQRQRLLTSIYSASFFFTLHYAFLLYIGSSFLGQFFPGDTTARAVSTIYIVSSIISVWTIFKMPVLFRQFGLAHTTYGLLYTAALASLGLAAAGSAWIAIPLFILLSTSQIVLRYALDIYIEKFSKEEATGRIRGIFLTVINTAIALSPFLVGYIISKDGFRLVYLFAAALVILAVSTTLGKLRKVPEGTYHSAPLLATVKKILRRPNIYHIFATNLILELFYAWMVIYTPIYLVTELGFTWSDVGIIFSIMLIPFVLIELPAGYMADKHWGEKELLTVGLFIMGISTISLAFLDARTILPWAVLLFTTRVGAALIEIMSDTYFFKKVSPVDTDIIGLFRSAKPIATIGAPILATIILAAGTHKTLYLVLGAVVLYGIRHSLALKDTR